MKKKSSQHYVDNKRLYGEMLHYINALNEAKQNGLTGNELPRISNYIGKCIFLIAQKLATKPNFASYSFKDEMISDGIENCLMYIHNFNPDKSTNPFAYFTQIIFYAFLRRIQKEQKQSYIKHKALVNSSINNTLVNMGSEDAGHFSVVYAQLDTDKSANLINKFEKPKPVKEKPKSGVEKFMGEDNE